MFSKLLVIIVAMGLTAMGLLIVRQQRIDAAHEIARTHEQIREHERALWRIRSEIARRCRPDEIRRLIESLPEQWTALPDPVCTHRQPESAPAAAGCASEHRTLGPLTSIETTAEDERLGG